MATRSTLAFLRTETGSGLLLAAMAAAAIAWANSPWSDGYLALIGREIPVQLGPFRETLSLGAWVRTALMPVFFFVVGLQIKHEVVRGELANPRRLALPLLAALGGIAVPAAVAVAFAGEVAAARGAWAATSATDLAMAVAALSLAGARLPSTLRVFLLTVAIVSHMGAAALIAVLFTGEARPWMLGGAAATLAVLFAMSRWRAAPYVFWAAGFLLLWGFTLKSGVDTAVAGVAAAFCAPLEPKRPGGSGVLAEMIEALHPYVAFFILPLFVLTAAGFVFGGDGLRVALSGVSLGVAAGLFLGKQAGVFGAALLAIGLKWARRPTGAKWLELYGVSLLCGVGFTLSLYIGGLVAPGDSLVQDQIRAGVILGSLASALTGMAVLAASQARRRPEAED